MNSPNAFLGSSIPYCIVCGEQMERLTTYNLKNNSKTDDHMFINRGKKKPNFAVRCKTTYCEQYKIEFYPPQFTLTVVNDEEIDKI